MHLSVATYLSSHLCWVGRQVNHEVHGDEDDCLESLYLLVLWFLSYMASYLN